MKKVLALALGVVLLLGLAGCGSSGGAAEISPAPEAEGSPAAEGSGLHHVEIDIADYGVVKLELDGDAAPITVENFLTLARDGFYDGLTFHRIMAGFMMQGGAPRSPEEAAEPIYGEFSANGWDNPISHVRGVISMARTSEPDSASSQFFIVHADSTFLDGQYAAFGYVTEGMEVVDAVCQAAQPIDDNGTIPAEEQPVIASVTVLD